MILILKHWFCLYWSSVSVVLKGKNEIPFIRWKIKLASSTTVRRSYENSFRILTVADTWNECYISSKCFITIIRFIFLTKIRQIYLLNILFSIFVFHVRNSDGNSFTLSIIIIPIRSWFIIERLICGFISWTIKFT